MNDTTTFNVKDLIAQDPATLDPQMQELVDKLKNGEIHLNSGPTDIVWTPDDVRQFKDSLAEMFGWTSKSSLSPISKPE